MRWWPHLLWWRDVCMSVCTGADVSALFAHGTLFTRNSIMDTHFTPLFFHIQVIQFIFPHKGPASPAWDYNLQHFPAKKKNRAIIRTCSLNTVNHLPFRLRFFFLYFDIYSEMPSDSKEKDKIKISILPATALDIEIVNSERRVIFTGSQSALGIRC